ncbi:MAG: hypothetical protein HKN68_19215 [Saprospiraceae bacterium]|nr:hypothetical protein [Saprospiraceae bacterium]
MTTFQVFSYISGYSAIIPFIVGFIYFRKFKPYCKWMMVLVVVSLTIDIASFYLRSIGISTLPYVHQFFLLQVPIIHMVYEKSKPPHSGLLIANRAITIIAVTLIIYFLWGRWSNERMVLQVPWISTIACILISLNYMFGRVSFSRLDEELINPPMMIFGLILIYQCSIISTFAAYETLIRDIYKLKLVVYIIFNIVLAYFFFRQSKVN